MRNRLKFAALIASAVAGLAFGAVSFAAETPQISKSIVKQLKAAQDAMTANHLDEALAKVKEAQATPGDKTSYDTYAMNVLMLQIYSKKQDYSSATPVLESLSQSQYSAPDLQKQYLKALFGIYYQSKDYNKALQTGETLIKRGAGDNETLISMADVQNHLGDCKAANDFVQQVVAHQERPEERLLAFQWNCDVKLRDQAAASKVIEKLVSYYPKQEYWLNALQPLTKLDIKDEHLKLNVYRLMDDVGVMRLPGQYAEMAEEALDVGYPGLTQAVLQEAFSKNIFTEQRDKDRYTHLLDGAKQRAATDQAGLGKQEEVANAAASGDALVQVGAAYLSYGQNDKALSAINRGIAKGGLKSADEANLLLGIVQLKMKNTGEAQHSFEKVSGSSNATYASLGRLWALHAGAHNV